MNRSFFLLFSLTLLFLYGTIHSYAVCVGENSFCKASTEKYYVAPEQLAISSQGIFLNLKGEWLQAEALFSDQGGIFVRHFTPSAYGCVDPYNACRNCGRCVHETYDICPYCGKPA